MSFPFMASAFWDWTEPVQFNVVSTVAVDYQAIETPQNQIVFDAVIEPIPPRLLMMKPEGERKFKYWTLWTEQPLEPDAILQDEHGAMYRMIKETPWRSGDYKEYEIVEAPKVPYAGQ